MFGILPKVIVDVIQTSFTPFRAPEFSVLASLKPPAIAYASIIKQWQKRVGNAHAENSVRFQNSEALA